MNLLFICTGNSARSQMAEGLINYFYNDKFEAFSGGTKPSKVNPYAIKVMKEIGIDISSHRSKSFTEFYGKEIDIAVTVCDNAKKVCPIFPGAKLNLHNTFIDPADAKGTDKEILNVFRTVRDQIKDWIEKNLIDEKTSN
ncbi:MAG: arsenate reductase ArsC [Promethearchaeota archaeon]|nr:MAG: arsenate reductase ArsC [Candidatus Lokiarchaeota archaeon]